VAPYITQALAQAKLISISGGEGGGAPGSALQNITSVIQTVLAAQLVSKAGITISGSESSETANQDPGDQSGR